MRVSALRVCAYRAAKSGFLVMWNFEKDIVLKSEGIISHEHLLMLFSNHIFLNRRKHSPSCSFHDLFPVLLESSFLLTNTDAHSDSGH